MSVTGFHLGADLRSDVANMRLGADLRSQRVQIVFVLNENVQFAFVPKFTFFPQMSLFPVLPHI